MLFLVIIIAHKQSCYALSNWECQIQNVCFPNMSAQIKKHLGEGRIRDILAMIWLFPLAGFVLFCFVFLVEVVKLSHHSRQETCVWWHSRCGAHVLTKCLFINLISTYDHRLVMQQVEDTEGWTPRNWPSPTVTVSLGLHLLTGKSHLSFIRHLLALPLSRSWIKEWK